MGDNHHDYDKNIEMWKIKKLKIFLEEARGKGSSMISIIMPPSDEVSRVTEMLGDVYRNALNMNPKADLGAITCAQQRLKLYNKVPPNGLVLYTGTIVNDEGEEKKVTIDFEPFRPINRTVYLCDDNMFHTEALNELLEPDVKFGFIVVDHVETVFGTLSGNRIEVLRKFYAGTPMEHGERELSAAHVRKTAELATHYYIDPSTSHPNVFGLILAGFDKLKTELCQSDMFDPRLGANILKVVDLSYGGEYGFYQAIELSSEILANSNVKFIQEKRLIRNYFGEISPDTGKSVWGLEDTLKALDSGSVETLIVWEDIDINRYVLKKVATGETVIKHLNTDNFKAEEDSDLILEEKMSLLEWLANEYMRFGIGLAFVSNQSNEGSQFHRCFGGVGAILRYPLHVTYDDDDSEKLADGCLNQPARAIGVTH